MITGGNNEILTNIATANEAIRGSFAEHQEELRWLAVFLTGNEQVAEACVVDACEFSQKLFELMPDRLPVSPAFAAIDSALEIQRARIADLSPIYENCLCLHTSHEQLSRESLEFVVMESDVIRLRLDTLCRFVLIICGIEKFTCAEAARWLGISTLAVEGAYCAAVDALEVVDCEAQMDCSTGLATWN